MTLRTVGVVSAPLNPGVVMGAFAASLSAREPTDLRPLAAMVALLGT